MEHNDDIDLYLRKKFADETCEPSTYARLELFEKLEGGLRRKDRLRHYKTWVVFAALLLFGPQFDSTDDLTSANDLEKIAKQEVLLTATPTGFGDAAIQNEVSTPNGHHEAPVLGHTDQIERDEQKHESEPRHLIHADLTELENDLSHHTDLIVAEAAIKSTDKDIDGVTESEIDSLMRLAKYALQYQEADLAAQRAYALEMLSDIENESKPKNQKGFGQRIKRGFEKFRTIIAN